MKKKPKAKTPPKQVKEISEAWLGKDPFTKEEFLALLEEHAGNITKICRVLKRSKTTLYRYIHHWEMQKDLNDAREIMIDEAEAGLRDNILAGKEASIIFALKTRAQNRGYIERQHVAHTTAGVKINEITVKIIHTDTSALKEADGN